MRGYTSEQVRRVTKAMAKKLYESGIPIYLTPCKTNPEEVEVHKAETGMDFKEMVAQYTEKTCCYKTGHYPSFYIKE